MGAIIKEETVTGATIGKAVQALMDSDRIEVGDGANTYDNGGWHNHSGGIKVVDRTEFDKIVREQDVDKHGYIYACECLKPIANEMKIKTEVTRFPNTGTRKWLTVYVAVPRYGASEYPRINIMEEKQADAIIKARAYVEKNPGCPLRVQIGKKLIGTKGGEVVAEISYKKSSKERDGRWDIIGCMPY